MRSCTRGSLVWALAGLASLVGHGKLPGQSASPKSCANQGWLMCVRQTRVLSAEDGYWSLATTKQLAYSPDGELWALGQINARWKSVLKILSKKDGTVLWSLPAETHYDMGVSLVAFTPDSKFVISS